MSIIRKCVTALSAGVLFVSLAWAQSGMTDSQVLEYVQRGVAEGRNRQELAAELSLKGVSRAQAERVYGLYMAHQEAPQATRPASAGERRHSVNVAANTDYEANPHQELQPREEAEGRQMAANVFGRNIFRSHNMSFAPSENMATPRNYRLGPGDEIIIDVFGRNQTTLRDVISPEGSINVDVLGPLYLSGKTIEEANAYLKKRLSQIYSGLDDHSGTDMRLTLGQIRSIQINVMGDVAAPGTYVLSGFATAFHAIYRAGGVVDPGTLRNIKVVRSGRTVGIVDVYEYMMKGSQETDIRLEEGDVILVSAYEEMVQVEGLVKRPMFFELKSGETVADLLAYAGGFALGANENNVTVFRQQGRSLEVCTVPNEAFGTFRLRNGDRIDVSGQQSRFENRTAVNGAVYRPGAYELGEVRTAKALIQKAGGLLPEAFTDRVVIHREHPDKTREVFSLNLTEILAGKAPDFVLQNNDELFVASLDNLKERGTMTISGMVNKPGTFPFAENTTIEDFIILAGGLRDGASTSRVDVTRRKKDVDGLLATNDIGEMYSFSLKEGLVADGDRSFVLEPYDEVLVHQSPSYNAQRHFSVAGEVNFPGEYTLTSREERVSDLIAKAGGITPFAYSKGARLVRAATAEEMRQAQEINEVLLQMTDSLSRKQSVTNAVYFVAIDLEAALNNPGGESDVVLREGDRLEIPVRSNVVRIHGAVMHPVSVSYNASMSLADYIDAAGGYAKDAQRNKAYVVSMDGRARKLRVASRIEPGDEIFVPLKKRRNQKADYTGLVAITSAAASVSTLGMVVVSILNQK